MNANGIQLVPFTQEELAEVQVTVVCKLLELNREIRNGNMDDPRTNKELRTLIKVSDKVSKYSQQSR